MKKYLIANWKMQLLNSEAGKLAGDLVEEKIKKDVEVVLCPSFTALSFVAKEIKGSFIKLGAQNVWYHEKGAYTGEVSPIQLKGLGVEYVILGHSERRKYLNETDEEINLKIKAVLENGMTPVVCVGETFEERRVGRTDLVLIRQIIKGLEDVKLEAGQKLLVAYEPVWVIGTGQAIEPADAEKALRVIESNLKDIFEEGDDVQIIYGGSVDANNVSEFVKEDMFSGALVGGASLTKEKFQSLINKV